MNPTTIYQQLLHKQQQATKSFAVLIDPDKTSGKALDRLIALSLQAQVDYFFVGGSLIVGNELSEVVQHLKTQTQIPVILFPGNSAHIDYQADAILLLSLISGRNPDFLIGQHILAAPLLRKSNLEIISTGYMLIDGGKQTTVSYISNTTPIPQNKPEIAACTAMAGEMLGLKITYLDAGSGAEQAISTNMVSLVKKSTHSPLVVGGGIKDAATAAAILQAGADVIVVGNSIEENPQLIIEIGAVVKKKNTI